MLRRDMRELELKTKPTRKPPEMLLKKTVLTGMPSKIDAELLTMNVLRLKDRLPLSREKNTRLLSRPAKRKSQLALRPIEKLLKSEELNGKPNRSKLDRTLLLVWRLRELQPRREERKPSPLLRRLESLMRRELLLSLRKLARDVKSVRLLSRPTSNSETLPSDLSLPLVMLKLELTSELEVFTLTTLDLMGTTTTEG